MDVVMMVSWQVEQQHIKEKQIIRDQLEQEQKEKKMIREQLQKEHVMELKVCETPLVKAQLVVYIFQDCSIKGTSTPTIEYYCTSI